MGPLKSMGPGVIVPHCPPLGGPGRRYNDPGADGLQEGRWLQPMSSRRGPSKWHWEISMWSLKTFFFLRSPNFDQKNRSNFREDHFFFEITSFFGPNYSIFSVYFLLHKIGNPSYLSWPRAHVWSLAPLPVGRKKAPVSVLDCQIQNNKRTLWKQFAWTKTVSAD